ncbi:MAG: tetratricopeptide repeat protein [Myxococcota bacterium]|nr:tetratricopeptide repeat protein [Myxococcota bacterium]
MRQRSARPLATALVAGLVVFGLGACSSDESKFARHLESAREFEEEGKNKEALLELRSALQIDPKSAEVNFRIAELLSDERKLADASFFYRETTRLDPARTDAALAEAKLITFDDTARAEELVNQVIEREPSNPTAYVRRSEIALARAKTEDALQAALTATELAPKDGMAWMQLGIVHLARIREHTLKGESVPQEVFQAAEKAFQRTAEIFPDGHRVRVELGRLYAVWPDHEKQAEAAFRDAVGVAKSKSSRARSAGAAISYARAVGNEEFLRWAIEQQVEAAPDNLDSWTSLAQLEERRAKGSGEAVYERMLEQKPQEIDAHVRYAGFLYEQDRAQEAYDHLIAQADAGVGAPVALDQVVTLQLRSNDLDAARTTYERLAREFPADPRTELAKGRIALVENRNDDAALALRHYVGSQETAEGQQLLAFAELRRNAIPAAVAAIDRAVALAPAQAVEALRIKAAIHAAANDHAQTLQTLNRIQRDSGSLRNNEKLLYAQTLYALGRRPGAKVLLEELLAGETPPVSAMLEFAQQEGAREPDRARGYIEQALAKQPGNAQALRMLAQLDLAAGKADQALARIDEAAKSQPLTPPLLLLRAQILASRQDYAGAEEEARRAFAAAPSLPGALELLANLYVAQDRVDEAIASFLEAETAGALPPSGQQLLARLYVTAGRDAEAKPLYEKVLAARSDLPGAKNDLAWILAKEGSDLERALTLAQEAQQAEPESAEVADTLGYVYLKKNLNDPALQQFEYAIELSQRGKSATSPERPEYHYHAGLALQALGRHDQAAASFERALALGNFDEAEDARRRLEAAKAGASGPG